MTEGEASRRVNNLVFEVCTKLFKGTDISYGFVADGIIQFIEKAVRQEITNKQDDLARKELERKNQEAVRMVREFQIMTKDEWKNQSERKF